MIEPPWYAFLAIQRLKPSFVGYMTLQLEFEVCLGRTLGCTSIGFGLVRILYSGRLLIICHFSQVPIVFGVRSRVDVVIPAA